MMSRLFGLLFLITAVCLLSFAPAQSSADCRRVVRVQHVVEAAPVVAAVYAPIPVAAYSVGYADAATQFLIEEFKQNKAELQALRQQVQQLQQGSPDAPPKLPTAQEHPGLTFLKKSCVACHDAGVAKAKGGDNTFFTFGRPVDFNSEQKLKIIGELYSGRMPRGGKATDEEVAAVIGLFDTRLAAAKAETIKAPPMPLPPAK